MHVDLYMLSSPQNACTKRKKKGRKIERERERKWSISLKIAFMFPLSACLFATYWLYIDWYLEYESYTKLLEITILLALLKVLHLPARIVSTKWMLLSKGGHELGLEEVNLDPSTCPQKSGLRSIHRWSNWTRIVLDPAWPKYWPGSVGHSAPGPGGLTFWVCHNVYSTGQKILNHLNAFFWSWLQCSNSAATRRDEKEKEISSFDANQAHGPREPRVVHLFIYLFLLLV